MTQLKRTRHPTLRILRQGGLVALAIGVVALGLFVPHAGEFLIVEDRFAHADVAVVLAGLPTSRALAVRDLYRQGRVDEILILPEPANKIEGEAVSDQVNEELVRLKLVNPNRPQWALRILLATGIPKERITVLPLPADGTISEGPLVRAVLRDRSLKSLVVITSKSASRRARFIFRQSFRKTPVQVFSYPTPYDPFQSHRWWTHPRNALTVVTEYEKLLLNTWTLAVSPRHD